MNKVETSKEVKKVSKEELKSIRNLLKNDKDFLEQEEIENYKRILEENEEDNEEYYENYEMRKLEREASLEYSYVSKLETKKEKLDAEKVIRNSARNFYQMYPVIRKKVGSLEDLIQEIKFMLLAKANEGYYVNSLSLLKAVIVRYLIDVLRTSKVHYELEDENFDMLQCDSETHRISGEERLFQESSEARENNISADLDRKEFDAIEIVEGILNSEDFKNLKEKQKIETKKLIFSKAIHNAGLNSSYFWNQYKEFENELDEEKKEILAEGIAYKESTGNYEQMTDDVMLKTFMNIKTGINAGSAGRITKTIPEFLKNVYTKNGGKLYT